MTTRTNTKTIEAGDLVTVLRGAEKGYQFNVEAVTEAAILDSLGNEYKRGNLRIDEKGLPAIEPEVEPVVTPTRPKVSRGRRPAEAGELPLCLCGCGQQVLKSNRSFRQGHDQRYRGQQIRDLETATDVEQMEEAIANLQRHWDYSRSELQARAKGLEAPEEETEA